MCLHTGWARSGTTIFTKWCNIGFCNSPSSVSDFNASKLLCTINSSGSDSPWNRKTRQLSYYLVNVCITFESRDKAVNSYNQSTVKHKSVVFRKSAYFIVYILKYLPCWYIFCLQNNCKNNYKTILKGL